MRFVTRLSGSADSPDVERQRLKYIIVATVQRLVSRALDRAGLPSQAEDCRTATTLTAAGRAAVRAKTAAYAYSIAVRDSTRWAVAGDAADVADAAATAARAARRSAADWDRAAVAAASTVLLAAATSGDDAAEAATPAEIFSEAIAILDGALAIGNRATDIDAALVLERMNKIRRAFVFVERTA